MCRDVLLLLWSTKFYNYEFLYDKYIILIFKMALLFLVYTCLKHFFLHIFKNNFCVQELEQKRSCPVVWVYSMARYSPKAHCPKNCVNLFIKSRLYRWWNSTRWRRCNSTVHVLFMCRIYICVQNHAYTLYRYCTYAVASSPDVTGLVFMLRSRLLGRWGRKM